MAKFKNLPLIEIFLRYKAFSMEYLFTWDYVPTHTIKKVSMAYNIQMKRKQYKKS